jgi:hypothetical protein
MYGYISAADERARACLEEIHHLSSGFVLEFEFNRFDNGFRGGTMPTASIGKVKDNMRFSRSLMVHLCAL